MILKGKGHFGGVRLTWRSSADLVGEIKLERKGLHNGSRLTWVRVNINKH